jgi:hypothetical protein
MPTHNIINFQCTHKKRSLGFWISSFCILQKSGMQLEEYAKKVKLKLHLLTCYVAWYHIRVLVLHDFYAA